MLQDLSTVVAAAATCAIDQAGAMRGGAAHSRAWKGSFGGAPFSFRIGLGLGRFNGDQ